MKKSFLVTLSLLFCTSHSIAQKITLKTNLLYGSYAQTPNLSMEFGLGKRITLDISGGYNPWNRTGSAGNNKKLVHWIVQPELRYWTCQRFNGHFFGIHAFGSQYNISEYELPLLFGKGSKDYRYEGWAAGGGISYGYQWILGKHWNLEATIGVGYAYLKYDKYDCPKCGDYVGEYSKSYFGPTKAGVSLIYVF